MGVSAGGLLSAYLKVNGYSREAKAETEAQLEVLESALREGCIGQLPEIYGRRKSCLVKRLFCQAGVSASSSGFLNGWKSMNKNGRETAENELRNLSEQQEGSIYGIYRSIS